MISPLVKGGIMNTGLIVLIVVLAIVLIIVIWAISVYNSVRKANLKCDEALSGIDVALAKRHDVLTKSLGAVNKYVDHEKTTLLKSIELRKDSSVSEKIKNNEKMDELKNYIVALAENYPELKASENFAVLQNNIEDTEEHLQASRRAYNAAVTRYNEYHITFPNSLIANRIKPDKREFFEATEVQKEDVEIK